jgi:aminodeoxyfutalosine synthase
MLYGHRKLFSPSHHASASGVADKTHGFNCFIPLKFRNKDNEMSYLQEAITEDLLCYSMAEFSLITFLI